MTGAAITDSAPGQLLLMGLRPPPVSELNATGSYEFTVETAVEGSEDLQPIGASPRAWVLQPIERLRQVDENGVPLLLGETVAVVGTLTMEPWRLTDARTEAYIQDDTAGINVFSFRTDFDVFFDPGAPLVVRGRILNFNGLMEIEPIGVADIVEGAGYFSLPEPEPVEVSVAELQAAGEEMEGRLVRVPNLFVVSGTWPATPAQATLVVSDGTGQIELVALPSNIELFDTPPTFPATITGVVSQRVLEAPYHGGYRLLPRTPADFEEGTALVGPTAMDDTFLAPAGDQIALNVADNDLVPAGGEFTLMVEDDDRLQVSGTQILFESADPGEVTFTYTIIDQHDLTDTATVTVTVVPVPEVAPVINEFLFNPPGTDTQEYIEILGMADTDYSAYSILVIEGDGAGAGVIDRVYRVGTTNEHGLWVTPFLSGELENGTQTLQLVFCLMSDPAALVGKDQSLASYVWVEDSVAVTDGDGTDTTYAVVTLTPDFDGGTSTVDGASRRPAAYWTGGPEDWVRNDPSGAGLPGPDTEGAVAARGLAYNTPGLPNEIEPAKPPTVYYEEFVADRRYFSAEEALDAGISGADADPDGDGLSNLLEFALGTHPREHTAQPYQLVFEEGLWRLKFTWRAATAASIWVEVRREMGGEEGWEAVIELRDSEAMFYDGIPVAYVGTSSVPDDEIQIPTEVNFDPANVDASFFLRLRVTYIPDSP